jgi:NAD(P)-dependent dehydrogenase (short-subunit alcohol dehydrogenase family)
MKLKDKVAVITGAGSGIGRATALLFSREGAKVAVVDANKDTARETVDLIKRNGGEAIFIKADVSKSGEVQNMMKETLKKYGKLDVLFNNAGIEGQQAPTAECSEENFDRVIAINLKGEFLGMKY